MSGAIVFLTIIGLCLIVGSFIFFDKKEEKKQVVVLNDYELDEKEMAKLQESIREVAKEYSDELIEKTKTDLNQVTTAKMLEINELTEQALEDLKKSHQECVFLFDMLENKSSKLKEYVSASAEKLFSMQASVARVVPEEKKEEVDNFFREPTPESQVREHLMEQVEQNKDVEFFEEDMLGTEDVQERNQQILAMNAAGKSPIEIAKELDLGVGEVQLVVDLFQGE